MGDRDIGSTGRPVSSGLQVPGEPGHFRARRRLLGVFPRRLYPSKYPSIVPAEMSSVPRL